MLPSAAQIRKRTAATSAALANSPPAINSSTTPHRKSGPGSQLLPGHFLLPLLFFGFLITIVSFTLHRHTSLPDPLPATVSPHLFSEERARVHVAALTGAGIRTTGSVANEITAMDYLIRALDDIRTQMPKNGGWELEVSIQRPSGGFDLNFLGGFTSAYIAVPNIAARLVPTQRRYAQHKPAETSLLISAHYDSALGTLAATDDAANIANMLEGLRALTHSESLASAVIFLFNGAEETILQASHGFITQHPWASTISAFINLEGAGGSGRELVFQTGPKNDWLARAYSSKAPRPFASIVGQDIFQSDIIPSDTDFRIYRDYGKIPGLDVAYISNGFVYHTILDTIEQVNRGSLQRCGENLVATLKELVDSPYLILTHRSYQAQCSATAKAGGNIEQLVQKHQEALRTSSASPLTKQDMEAVINANVCLELETKHDAVYFDIMGFFVLIYSIHTATYLNWAGAVFVAGYLVKQQFKRRAAAATAKTHKDKPVAIEQHRSFLGAVGVTLASLFGAISFTVVIGLVLALVTPMAWFSTAPLVIGVFILPVITMYCIIQRWFNRKTAEKSDNWFGEAFEQEEVAYDAALFLWCTLLVVLTLFHVGSAFLALTWCVIPLFGRTVAHALEQLLATSNDTLDSKGDVQKGWLFVAGYFLGLVLPLILSSQASIVVYEFFLPLMGRSGTMVPSDLILAVILSVLVGVACLMALSIVHVIYHWKILRNILVGIIITALCIALSGSLFPYAKMTPKRVYLQHVERVFHPRHSDSFQSFTKDFATSTAAATSVELNDRTKLRNSFGSSDRGLWMIAMDYLNIKPFSSMEVPAELFSDTQSGKTNFLSLGKQLTCPVDPAENKASLFCNLPFYLPLAALVPGNYWFPLPASKSPKPPMPTMRLEKVETLPALEGYTRRKKLYFHVENVSTHMTLYLNNRPGGMVSKLLSWSLGESQETSTESKPSLGRHYQLKGTPDEFFVYFASGMPDGGDFEIHSHEDAMKALKALPKADNFLAAKREWKFWLEIADPVDDSNSKTETPYLDLAIAAHYMPPDNNGFIDALLPFFPHWVSPVWFTSMYASFQF